MAAVSSSPWTERELLLSSEQIPEPALSEPETELRSAEVCHPAVPAGKQEPAEQVPVPGIRTGTADVRSELQELPERIYSENKPLRPLL